MYESIKFLYINYSEKYKEICFLYIIKVRSDYKRRYKINKTNKSSVTGKTFIIRRFPFNFKFS